MNDIPDEIKLFKSQVYYIDKENSIKTVIHYKQISDNKKAIIWIPGRNDYFAHYHITYNIPKYDIYAIDLRGCGDAKMDIDIPHYVEDLTYYFQELNLLYDEFIGENKKKYDEIILYGHSTGGLIAVIYYDYNKSNQINKLILNSPFFEINESLITRFIIKYVLYYLSVIFPKIDISRETGTQNDILEYIKKFYKININNKSEKNIPIILSWLASVIYQQYKIQTGLIKIDIPILVLSSNKSISILDDINISGDSVLDINTMHFYSKKITSKPSFSNLNIEIIYNAIHDVLFSNGDINDINTSLGLGFFKFKEFIES